jgi:hypothetical protein
MTCSHQHTSKKEERAGKKWKRQDCDKTEKTGQSAHSDGTAVSIAIMLQSGQPKNFRLIPGRGKRYFSSPKHLYQFWGPTQPPIQWVKLGKDITVWAWKGPLGSRRLRLPGFLDSWHMKVARLSARRTSRLYPGTHFCYRLS